MLTFHRIKRNQEESPLLRLPAEIRNRIYEYALGLGRTFRMDIRRNANLVGVDKKSKEKNCLSLLRACRQIYAEAVLIPFRVNTFVFHGQHIFDEWTSTVLPIRREAVASIELRTTSRRIMMWTHNRTSDYALFPWSKFPGLKKIHIHVLRAGTSYDEQTLAKFE